jgi:hypothetical protein
MSQAFVREGDDQWLSDIPPTMNALLRFLTRENNGVRVYEIKTVITNDREVHLMSNGLSYFRQNNQWQLLS